MTQHQPQSQPIRHNARDGASQQNIPQPDRVPKSTPDAPLSGGEG